jgi:hypothetical protein
LLGRIPVHAITHVLFVHQGLRVFGALAERGRDAELRIRLRRCLGLRSTSRLGVGLGELLADLAGQVFRIDAQGRWRLVDTDGDLEERDALRCGVACA